MIQGFLILLLRSCRFRTQGSRSKMNKKQNTEHYDKQNIDDSQFKKTCGATSSMTRQTTRSARRIGPNTKCDVWRHMELSQFDVPETDGVFSANESLLRALTQKTVSAPPQNIKGKCGRWVRHKQRQKKSTHSKLRVDNGTICDRQTSFGVHAHPHHARARC